MGGMVGSLGQVSVLELGGDGVGEEEEVVDKAQLAHLCIHNLRGLGPGRPPVPDSQSPEPAGGAGASGWTGESGVRAASAA